MFVRLEQVLGAVVSLETKDVFLFCVVVGDVDDGRLDRNRLIFKGEWIHLGTQRERGDNHGCLTCIYMVTILTVQQSYNIYCNINVNVINLAKMWPCLGTVPTGSRLIMLMLCK